MPVISLSFKNVEKTITDPLWNKNGSSVPMNYYSPGSFTLLLTMKSARIIRTNEPLLVEEIAVPRPKYDQVLVRVQSAGVCHSDLHLWKGGYVGPDGSFVKVQDRGVRFPLTTVGIWEYIRFGLYKKS